MDAYLDYLKTRMEKLPTHKVEEYRYAQAEFNRALAFARREGATVKYALSQKN